MKKRIPIGLKSYDKLKKGNYYVVDKTMMICDFLARALRKDHQYVDDGRIL